MEGRLRIVPWNSGLQRRLCLLGRWESPCSTTAWSRRATSRARFMPGVWPMYLGVDRRDATAEATVVIGKIARVHFLDAIRDCWGGEAMSSEPSLLTRRGVPCIDRAGHGAVSIAPFATAQSPKAGGPCGWPLNPISPVGTPTAPEASRGICRGQPLQ